MSFTSWKFCSVSVIIFEQKQNRTFVKASTFCAFIMKWRAKGERTRCLQISLHFINNQHVRHAGVCFSEKLHSPVAEPPCYQINAWTRSLDWRIGHFRSKKAAVWLNLPIINHFMQSFNLKFLMISFDLSVSFSKFKIRFP